MKRTPIKKKTRARRIMQECDVIVKERIHERDGWRCVASGQAGVNCSTTERILHAAHILPKGKNQRLRWEMDNLVSLCFFHHIIWAHKDPLAFSAWFRSAYPGREERLRELARCAPKIDLHELRKELRG